MDWGGGVCMEEGGSAYTKYVLDYFEICVCVYSFTQFFDKGIPLLSAVKNINV